MNKQQEQLLQMLKEIDAICTKNDITYFVGMGTLIGAVRHGGFLPWDDDADVLMPYKDFERFKEVCAEGLPEHRYLRSPDRNEAYCNILTRYVSTETTVIHTCQSLHDDDIAGEVIDIFALDPIADGDEAYEGYLKDMYLYSSVVNYANANGARVELDANRYKKYHEIDLEHGRSYVTKLLEQNLASHFSPDGHRYAFRWIGHPTTFERSWFENSTEVQFEGFSFKAPEKINDFLTYFYGEEWIELPSSINPAKHDIAASAHLYYKNALEFYRPKYDRDTMRRESAERIYMRLKHAEANNRTVDERVRTKGRIIAHDTAVLVANNREAFDAALAGKDGKTLAVILNDYLSWQLGIKAIGRLTNGGMYRYRHPVLADVDERIFQGALYALITTGRTGHASRLLQLWKQENRYMTDALQEVAETIAEYRASMNDYQFGRHEAGAQRAHALTEAFTDTSHFLQLECAHLAKIWNSSGTDADRAALALAVEKGRSLFPHDGVYLKLYADLQRDSGADAEARALYLQAAESTRNGFVLREIGELTGYYPSWLREPAWAKAAHVPQWDGPTPEPLPAEVEPVVPGLKDPRKDYLFALLCELAELLDAHGIEYVLHPLAASALCTYGQLPDTIGAYTLVCKPEDIRKAVRILETKGTKGNVEYMGNSAFAKERVVRYRGDGSAYVSLKETEEHPENGLYASVAMLEPKPYSLGLERTLTEWDKSSSQQFNLAGKRAKMYAALHRLGKDRAKAGKKLFRLALREARGAHKRLCIRAGKNAISGIDPAMLRDARTVEFCGHAFKVPRDLAAYTAQCPANAPAIFLKTAPHTICTVSMDYDTLVSSDILDPAFFARVRQNRQNDKRSKQIYDRFKFNFLQIKLAVRLKELSMQLVPRKQEIAQLQEAGKFDRLANIFDGYLQCAREFSKIGSLNFDEDIYRAFTATQAHLKGSK